MLTELLYPLQLDDSPLHIAMAGDHANFCVEHLFSVHGIDVNIKIKVSQSTDY